MDITGNRGFILSKVAADNSGTVKPLCAQASAARIPGPPPLVRIATLLPLGTGWLASKIAESKSSPIESTMTIPASRKRASETTSDVAMAPVWERLALEPSGVLPPLIARMGFFVKNPPGYAAEYLRIIERFQVKQNNARCRVLFPSIAAYRLRRYRNGSRR